MNRIVPNNSRSPWSRSARTFLFLLPALLVLLASTSAKASCLDPANSAKGVKALPVVNTGNHSGDDFFGPPTIVGLWQVTLTASDGSIFGRTYKTWHADRTEWEQNISVPGGGYCYGVWKEIAPRTVKLHHLGFIFGNPDGSLSANFVMEETDTVALNNGSYTGYFDFKEYDSATGALIVEIKGSVSATRITVD